MHVQGPTADSAPLIFLYPAPNSPSKMNVSSTKLLIVNQSVSNSPS